MAAEKSSLHGALAAPGSSTNELVGLTPLAAERLSDHLASLI